MYALTPCHRHGIIPRLAIFLVIGACAAAPLPAQESPAQWLTRVFDPTSLGIQPFPGASLNRKLSVDSIQLERGGDKRIAVYILPLEQLKAAAEHYGTQLGQPPQANAAETKFAAYTFDFTSENSAGQKFHGLRLVITRSQFVDGKGQITMEYSPKSKVQGPK